MLYHTLCIIPLFITHALAALVNVTIDDQFGDPSTGQHIAYSPEDAWQVGQTCQACTAKPTPAEDAYLGTWSDASFNPSGNATNDVPGQVIKASVSFTGVAVYVNVILTGSETSPDGNSDFTFLVDNATAGAFEKSPDGDKTYHFNQTIFSMSGLSNTSHTLSIEVGHSGNKSLVLLDSIIYTVDRGDNDSNSTSTTSTGNGASTSTTTSSSTSSTPSTAGSAPTSSTSLASLTFTSTATGTETPSSTSSGTKISAFGRPFVLGLALSLCLIV
ncbi:hypothetical protein PNOK_0049100 [Pyrrhoderma noxium]|uniref:Uncharacterized protein n=1 Tax=Pyrrhoderma noxium TaxID=2282107 RepID=A0A286UUZ9_9AGAM|nr:hypothetical protein PNOK_0049100 [Pyrrhoderma noxium]